MPRLKKLAEKAMKGNQEALDDMIMEAPAGALDEMSAEEFAKKMATDDDFADDIYSRMEGTKYGGHLSDDHDVDSERNDAKKKQMMSVMAQFEISPDAADSIANTMMDMIGKSGAKEDNPGDDYEASNAD